MTTHLTEDFEGTIDSSLTADGSASTAEAYEGSQSQLISVTWPSGGSIYASSDVGQRDNASDNVVVGAAMHIVSTGVEDAMCVAGTETTTATGIQYCGVLIQDDGSAEIRTVSGTAGAISNLDTGTQIGSITAGTFTLDDWIFVEIDVTFDQTAGTVDVYIDGTSVFSGTSLDTLATTWIPNTGVRGGVRYEPASVAGAQDFYTDYLQFTSGEAPPGPPGGSGGGESKKARPKLNIGLRSLSLS